MVAAILALEDGSVFNGTAIGAINKLDYTCGEVVFNTSITGYQEIITDPSYSEQMIMFTQPHIGNVGVNQDDSESNAGGKIWSKGIIIKSLSFVDSSWRSENSLNNYLITHNIIGIANIDTRALTVTLRTKGSLRGCIYILKNLKNQQEMEKFTACALNLARNHQSLEGLDLAKIVSCSAPYVWKQNKYDLNTKTTVTDSKHSSLYNKKFHIVVYDFGVKQQILKLLINRNCYVTVVPAKTSIEQVLDYQPDGILLSNGPGDPAACSYAISSTKELIKLGLPIFGICLGFQILALAFGGKTQKMKFGHHGANHPVKDLENDKVMITSQNHGFMVDQYSLSDDIIVTHKSLFDNTTQGFRHKSLPIFGFQGHPEASPGPHDIEGLFDNFINNIRRYTAQNTMNVLEDKVNH